MLSQFRFCFIHFWILGNSQLVSAYIIFLVAAESEVHAADLRVQRKIQRVLADVLGVKLRVDDDRLHQDARVSDPVVAPVGCSPPDYQARIPLHESPVDEPHVDLREIDVLSVRSLGDPPEPLQEEVLVVPQEPLGAEVLADLLRVSRLVLSSDLGEDRLCQALDHVLRSVPQIVRDLEADPLVAPGPLQLEVPEGGELRRDVLVSVPDACVAHGPVQHLAVAVFHFLLSPGPKCPKKGLADVRLRDRCAPRK